mgnify:CR=1 FL=1
MPFQNNYELPRKEQLKERVISYYQWVPYLFLVQAFMLYFPSIIWRTLESLSDFNLKGYTNQLNPKTKEDDETDAGDDEETQKLVYNTIAEDIVCRADYRVKEKYKKSGTISLLIFYIFIKLLYVLSAFGQLILISLLLRGSQQQINFTSLIADIPKWNLDERFPRMTLCNFTVYILNDQQRHWVQCTLPINIYIEKIYFFLRLWLPFLVLLGLLGMIKLFIEIRATKQEVARIKDFPSDLKSELNHDGYLVLLLIKKNSDLVAYRAILNEMKLIAANHNR